MVLDIKMCRFDNRPWGFRLVGGSDFEYPLTVVKVTEDSIAEEAGLRADDVIVRINDTPTSPLTHEEADQLIRSCGNVFYFGVQRENAHSEVPKFFPISETEYIPSAEINSEVMRKSPSICISSYEEEQNLLNQELNQEMQQQQQEEEQFRPIDVQPTSIEPRQEPEPLKEEVEIAAVMSGESEVLKDHNVLGIFPKPGVCMSSDVLRTLNEEAIKTKAEKDKENKKWTTFLQRPDRPIPKSKQQLEAERRAANAYKVQILISPARTPERGRSPAVESPPPVVLEPEQVKESTPPEPEVEEPPPTDSEVPNLEQIGETEKEQNDSEADTKDVDEEEKADKEKDTSPECKEAEADNNPDKVAAVVEEEPVESPKKELSPVKETVVKTEEELALERQLADVQRQLAALSNLPSTIQSTLDAVTRQLAEMLPAFKLQQQKTELKQQQNTETEVRETSLEKIEENAAQNSEEGIQDASNTEQSNDNNEAIDARIEHNNDSEVEAFNNGTHETSTARKDDATYMEEEQSTKKQKKFDVIEELEEHLERKNNPKRSKRAFGPLVPSSERPLVLPGGRRWYRPKDAYNDEFIAETLSAQAELITGHTLGTTFESPHLGYDPRVNFMKYQKPEKKIDLNKSEVYKVIHHLDRQPVRGIEVRPPVVPAEVDIRKAMQ